MSNQSKHYGQSDSFPSEMFMAKERERENLGESFDL